MSPHSGRQAGFRYAGSFATSWEMTMRLIIEARVEDPDARDATAGAVTLAVANGARAVLPNWASRSPKAGTCWPRPSRRWCRNKSAVG